MPFIAITFLIYYRGSKKTKRLAYFFLGYGLGMLGYFILIQSHVVSIANRNGLEILKSLTSDSVQEEYRSTSNFSIEEKNHPIRTYFQFIVNHPKEYTEQRLWALENMWGWSPAPTRSFTAKLLIAIRFPLLIIALIGLWRYRRDFNARIIFIPIAALTIVHVASYSGPRYTFIAEPFAICLASLVFYKKRTENEYCFSRAR